MLRSLKKPMAPLNNPEADKQKEEANSLYRQGMILMMWRGGGSRRERAGHHDDGMLRVQRIVVKITVHPRRAVILKGSAGKQECHNVL